MLNLGGFQAFSTGARPVWESACYRELVLGESLSSGKPDAEKLAPPKMVLGTLCESLAIVAAQLGALCKGGGATPIKQPLAKVQTTFGRAVEMCASFKTVQDNTTFYELLTTFVAQVKAITPGCSLVIPGGYKGGFVVYVLHCES